MARFAPYLKLIGIDPVTQDWDVEQDGDAVLVPIKVDATVQYDAVADMASWANPFALANNAAAAMFPTYILRGSETDPLGMFAAVITPVVPALLGNIAVGIVDGLPTNLETPGATNLAVPCGLLGCFLTPKFTIPNAGPFNLDVRGAVLSLAGPFLESALGVDLPDGYFATNEYITFRQNALPLLEPARLPFDAANVLFGTNLSNPFADATEEALTSLVSLGYTDVVRDPVTGAYTRTLDEAGLNADDGGVPFGTLPDNVDWSLVPQDIFNSLVRGFQKEFLNGGVPGVNDPLTEPQANAIAALANLLGLGGLVQGGLINNLPDIGESLGGGLPDLQLPGVLSTESDDDSVQRTAQISELPGPASLTVVPSAGEDVEKTTDTPAPQRNRPLLNLVTGTGNPGAAATVGNGRTQLRDALTDQRSQVREAVADTRDNLRDAVTDTRAGFKKVFNEVGSHVNDFVKGSSSTGKPTSTANDDDKGDQQAAS